VTLPRLLNHMSQILAHFGADSISGWFYFHNPPIRFESAYFLRITVKIQPTFANIINRKSLFYGNFKFDLILIPSGNPFCRGLKKDFSFSGETDDFKDKAPADKLLL
jgi:hypothetical protein